MKKFFFLHNISILKMIKIKVFYFKMNLCSFKINAIYGYANTYEFRFYIGILDRLCGCIRQRSIIVLINLFCPLSLWTITEHVVSSRIRYSAHEFSRVITPTKIYRQKVNRNLLYVCLCICVYTSQVMHYTQPTVDDVQQLHAAV